MGIKVVLVPGNGGANVFSDHWYPWITAQLQRDGAEVVAQNMPDPILAQKKYWLPFLEKEVSDDPNVIVIGHSSGAVAAMRFLEQHPLQGVVLVSACYTDLGSLEEKLSGYYHEPWQWQKIKEHAGWIEQFSSVDDPVVPVAEARYIHEHLGSSYHEFLDRGHFNANAEFPELVAVVREKIRIMR